MRRADPSRLIDAAAVARADERLQQDLRAVVRTDRGNPLMTVGRPRRKARVRCAG